MRLLKLPLGGDFDYCLDLHDPADRAYLRLVVAMATIELARRRTADQRISKTHVRRDIGVSRVRNARINAHGH